MTRTEARVAASRQGAGAVDGLFSGLFTLVACIGLARLRTVRQPRIALTQVRRLPEQRNTDDADILGPSGTRCVGVRAGAVK